jgi:hypothetical protein
MHRASAPFRSEHFIPRFPGSVLPLQKRVKIHRFLQCAQPRQILLAHSL